VGWWTRGSRAGAAVAAARRPQRIGRGAEGVRVRRGCSQRALARVKTHVAHYTRSAPFTTFACPSAASSDTHVHAPSAVHCCALLCAVVRCCVHLRCCAVRGAARSPVAAPARRRTRLRRPWRLCGAGCGVCGPRSTTCTPSKPCISRRYCVTRLIARRRVAAWTSAPVAVPVMPLHRAFWLFHRGCGGGRTGERAGYLLSIRE
jgi:hypothetical protein